jgi:hypothetical protein
MNQRGRYIGSIQLIYTVLTHRTVFFFKFKEQVPFKYKKKLSISIPMQMEDLEKTRIAVSICIHGG